MTQQRHATRTRSPFSRLNLFLTLTFVIVFLDQLTKVIARESLRLKSFSYFFDTFRLEYVENRGAFLSLGAQLAPNTRFWIFTVGVGIFVLLTIVFVFRSRNMTTWITTSLTLIVAGGIGNLIDRAQKGTVTDFMNMGIGWLRTGIFNVADVALMIGIGMQLLTIFKPEPSTPSRDQNSKARR